MTAKGGIRMGVETEKKFIRDGARYVCKKCKKKFFTKIEVEQCHDGH
jgi:transposase-like protein